MLTKRKWIIRHISNFGYLNFIFFFIKIYSIFFRSKFVFFYNGKNVKRIVLIRAIAISICFNWIKKKNWQNFKIDRFNFLAYFAVLTFTHMMDVVLNNQHWNFIGSFHKIYYYDLAIAWSLPLHIIFKFFVWYLFFF